ncbi:MAG: hypothetical protein FWF15_07540 [Oscillospiraceae bacterium]|nr:hypothetical protein [Oscillospiraceae bacterium]
MGRQQIKCHGSPERFEEVAEFIYDKFGSAIKYIADVAGGQGALTRLLNKKYNYQAEVIDPRGYSLKGVPNRAVEYTPQMASYYDLIVGLHPDEATRAVVESALIMPVLILPCCNFWDTTQKLGCRELVSSIENYFIEKKINYERIQFKFDGPKNIGLLTKS